jgi:dephospho-CoA kinase
MCGLTGGIGSGKSTVARMLVARGAVVVDADAIAREVVEPGTPALAALVETFGPEILLPDGSLDRPALAALAFVNDETRKKLEDITHPAIGAEFLRQLSEAPADGIVVHDVPLLVESKRGFEYDAVIVVEAPLELRFDRLEERGVPRDDAQRRSDLQATDEQRRKVATWVVDNSGDLAHLEQQIDAIWSDLEDRARAKVAEELRRSYYSSAGPMTAIDETRFGAALEGLDQTPDALASAVRGVLIHRDWAPFLGMTFDADRLADQQVRPVNEILARVLTLRDEPIAQTRELTDRMVAVCRHYAVLYTALLRRAGTPARSRAGFARYLGAGWGDHWITERWDGRWVRDDAQIGAVARSTLDLHFDPADMPPGEFLTGAEAWLRCRAGEADPEEFGIFDQRGLWFVRGNVPRDLAAVNKVELLPWDSWGTVAGPDWQPTATELEQVDDLARAIVADDPAEVRQRYQGMPVTRQIVSFVEGARIPVDLGDLIATGE